MSDEVRKGKRAMVVSDIATVGEAVKVLREIDGVVS